MNLDRFIQDYVLPSLQQRCFVHFTDGANLALIREHGFLSMRELQRRRTKVPRPGGNQWSRDADKASGMDASGHGVAKNAVEAAGWFAKAAEQNDPHAQAKLAEMYFFGEGGLPRSSIEAYKWETIAGEAGAKFFVAAPKGSIELSMTADEKREAIRLAERWKFDKGLTKVLPAPQSPDDRSFFFLSQRDLLAKCKSTSANDRTWCDAYIAGVVDTHSANREALKYDAGNVRFTL
jgi:hypothetical protein